MEGLSKVAVSSYDEIQAVTDKGTANRTGPTGFRV